MNFVDFRASDTGSSHRSFPDSGAGAEKTIKRPSGDQSVGTRLKDGSRAMVYAAADSHGLSLPPPAELLS
jgi:hypothetical protein